MLKIFDSILNFLAKLAPFAVAGTSILLFELAQPGLDFSACAWFFIVPAALVVLRGVGWKKWLFWSWISCYIAAILLLIWLRFVYPPLGWLGLFGLTLAYSAFPWAWFILLRWIFPKCHAGTPLWARLLMIFGLAGTWVLLEWTLTWFCTGFPWMPLAATQYAFPALLPLCQLGGPGVLSGVLVLINLGIARYIQRQFVELRDKKIIEKTFPALRHFLSVCPEFYIALVPVFAAIICFCWQAVEYDFKYEHKFTFAAVQTDFDPNEKYSPERVSENWRILRDLTTEIAGTRQTHGSGKIGETQKIVRSRELDFVLWPEAAMPFAVGAGTEFGDMIANLSKFTGTPIVAGTIALGEGDGYYNSVHVIDPKFGVGKYFVAKRHRVPFGEYVPFADILPLRKVVPVSEDCLAGTDFSPLLVRLRGNKVLHLGALICYEDVFPELGRECVLAGAKAIAVVTNDAWYGREAGAYQHMAHSVMQAVSLGVPVVRCGNAGWSGWISPMGQIFPMTSDGGNASTAGTIYFRGAQKFNVFGWPDELAGTTFYARHGNAWLLILCAILAILMAGTRLIFWNTDFTDLSTDFTDSSAIKNKE